MTLNVAPIVAVLMAAAGALVVLYLAFRLLAAWPARRYGEMITEFAVAVFVGWVCFAPDSAKTALTSIGHTVFG